MSHTYALIGCGRISKNHIYAALNSGFKIIALCDIDENKANALKKDCNLSEGLAFYRDYHQMLKNNKPDIVSIATPSDMHASMTIDCCKQGVNVIVEKPFAMSTNDIEKIICAARENSVIVTVCHQNRYNPAVQKAKELVNAGYIGEIYSVSANLLWNRNKDYYDQSDWRGTWTQDGGVLMNQGIHVIDLMNWFTESAPQTIKATTKNIMHPYIEAEDYAVAIIEYNNGCVGTINCTTNIYPNSLEETLYILGTRGIIKLGGESVNKIEILKAEGITNADEISTKYSIIPPNVYGYGHTSLFTDFGQSIDNRTIPQITVKDATPALEIVLGIYKAAKNNGCMEFPLHSFSTLEMKGYF